VRRSFEEITQNAFLLFIQKDTYHQAVFIVDGERATLEDVF
jgi:hypothetical protein